MRDSALFCLKDRVTTDIGLAKISLISLSEFAAKCNASSVGGKREHFSPIDEFASAKCCRTWEEKKKNERDVKIRKDERKERGGGAKGG